VYYYNVVPNVVVLLLPVVIPLPLHAAPPLITAVSSDTIILSSCRHKIRQHTRRYKWLPPPATVCRRVGGSSDGSGGSSDDGSSCDDGSTDKRVHLSI